jgi:hypothetical protein
VGDGRYRGDASTLGTPLASLKSSDRAGRWPLKRKPGYQIGLSLFEEERTKDDVVRARTESRNGRDMRREPWSHRRWKLARLLRGAGHGVQLSDHMEGSNGEAAFRHACLMGLEGIIAKRRDRP